MRLLKFRQNHFIKIINLPINKKYSLSNIFFIHNRRQKKKITTLHTLNNALKNKNTPFLLKINQKKKSYPCFKTNRFMRKRRSEIEAYKSIEKSTVLIFFHI